MNHQYLQQGAIAIRSVRYEFVVYVLAVLTWVTCTPLSAGTLEGMATYRERIALPPDAVFEAVLQDVSQADAPAGVLGHTTINPVGYPPFRFRITYDDAAVQPGRRYVVRATIKHRERLLFTADRDYPVFNNGRALLRILLVSVGAERRPLSRSESEADEIDLPASYEGELPGAGGPVLWHLDLLPQERYHLRVTYLNEPEPNHFDEIGRWKREPDTRHLVLHGGNEAPIVFLLEKGGDVLQKMDTEGKPIISSHHYTLQRLPQPALIEPRLELTGMFTYMADAATITLCADDGRLPVAMEGDYRALEAAYLQERRLPGEALLVSLDGLIAPRPSMETGQPPLPTLIVKRFINIWPRETCGNPLVDSVLHDTYWKLVRLNGVPVRIAEKQREPHLVFASDEPRISGNSGCNHMMGSYELDGDKLHLSRMAGTMMACLDGMELEQQFLQSMEKVVRYHISGSHLDLLDTAGVVIARFEAVALR